MPTRSYTDLIFAFCHAKLGNIETASDLMRTAITALAAIPDDRYGSRTVHKILSLAFQYRIEQAIAGKPHWGPLPERWHRTLAESSNSDHIGTMARYATDRLREQSRILEPIEQPNVYRDFLEPRSIESSMTEIEVIFDPKVLANTVRILLADKASDAVEGRMAILAVALPLSGRVGDDFAAELLELVQPTIDALSDPADFWNSRYCVLLLSRGLQIADHLGRQDWLRTFPALLRRLEDRSSMKTLRKLADEVVKVFIGCLIRQRMLNDLRSFIEERGSRVCRGMNLAALEADSEGDWPSVIHSLLPIAAGWIRLGERERAEEIIRSSLNLLSSGVAGQAQFKLNERVIRDLAVAFLSAVSQDACNPSFAAIEDMFSNVRRVKDGFVTMRYFARTGLRVAEAAALAVVAEDRRPFDHHELTARRELLVRLRSILSESGWDNPNA